MSDINAPVIQRVLAMKNIAAPVSYNLHDLLSGELGGFSPSYAAAITSGLEIPTLYSGMVMNAETSSTNHPLGLRTFTPRLSSKAVVLYSKLRVFDPTVMTTAKYVAAIKDVDMSEYDEVMLIQVVHAKMLAFTDCGIWDAARAEKVIDPLLLNQIKVLCIEMSALLLEIDDYIVNPESSGIQYSLNDVSLSQANADYISAMLERMTMTGEIHRPYNTITEIRKLQYNLETIAHPEFFLDVKGR